MRCISLLLAALVAGSTTLAAAVPTIVFVSGEFEYHSRETFPKYAKQFMSDYEVQAIVLERPNDEKVQSIPDLQKVDDADLVVIMIRRMVLPEEQLNHFKKYLQAGKPLVGLRTASHSFENWREFDAQVLGGNYQGHHANELKTTVNLVPGGQDNPLLRGVTTFVSDGSLYKNTPLRAGAKPILLGIVEGQPTEPVAWTHEYQGGRIFYTSLGHPNDFREESFLNLLHNGIQWTLNRPLVRRSSK